MKQLTANELRQKYLDFFKEKGHEVLPSFPVVPENDPTGLFINSGMHPLVPYLMGEKHPKGTRLVDSQKCIRTIDIEEVGDPTHHTFFEMLGNWSLGDYFKKEAIEWSWEFLTDEKWLGLHKNRLAVSVFEGDENAPFDQEAFGLWKEIFEKEGLPIERIAKLPKENNWWGPAGEMGPCGPDTEMFYWVGDPNEVPDSFNDDNALWMEIWNDVFMEFNKKADSTYEKLAKQNVDTGMGLIRVLAALRGLDDNYKTELFTPIIKKIEEISGKKYDESDVIKRAMRIVADHIKAAVFIIADGVEPSNTERGYILRRIIRRAVRQGHILGIEDNFTVEVAKVVVGMYEDVYPEVGNEKVMEELQKEEEKFRTSLDKGLKEFNTVFAIKVEEGKESISMNKAHAERIEKIAFNLFQTYGFPLEMTIEEAVARKIPINEERIREQFNRELEKHQELSRTASAGMFKGGLADKKEETTQLHTVAHLMLAGLRKVLGDHVHQKGSNINGERLRFDFSHPEKMTDEEKKQVEDFVNEAIAAKVPVEMQELSLDEAKEKGAEGAFESKYGDVVKVYSIAEPVEYASGGKGYSKEICGGPHVENTGDIKGKFKIKKEQSSSAGVRRIKAVLVS